MYLDTVVDNDKLRNELLPLMTMQESFRVITCGDVSLRKAEAQEPGKFYLTEKFSESILKK